MDPIDELFEEEETEEEAPEAPIITANLCGECGKPIPTYMTLYALCLLEEEETYYEVLLDLEWGDEDDY